MIALLGGSLGCLQGVQLILTTLPADLAAAVVLVIHRQASNEDLLTPLLQRCCVLPVTEAVDKEPLLDGHVYVAPPDYHLLTERDYLTLSIDDPVHYARPSIDALFESAALTFGAAAVAVVLTGAGCDGAAGAAMIETHGGMVLIEDPLTAFRADMPAAALAATRRARLLPSADLGAALCTLLAAGTQQHSYR
jgi:two-component system, chemotaxis family, protein-glutamate methylesterase/glutaminase